MMEHWAGVIMAAGAGSRMVSRIPKPLHKVCGKEMVRYPVELLQGLGIERILVVVSPATHTPVREALGDSVEYVIQPAPNGTGDAAAHAVAALPKDTANLVLLGSDSPLLRQESLQQLVEQHQASGSAMTMLTAPDMLAPDLGRVLRDEEGRIVALVEAADSDEDAWAPAEVNAGAYCFSRTWLEATLPRIAPSASGEIYLTSLVGLAAQDGDVVDSVASELPEEIFGVNDRIQLAQVETVMRWQILETLMRSGVTVQDPGSVYIDAGVAIGCDTVIRPNTSVLGNTAIGEGCEIGPNAVIQDSRIGNDCRVTASMLEEATLEDGIDVGPFSHLRPGSHLETGVHLGNYVEVKESRLGRGVLAGHFSYLGDATVGAGTNIGAGTITCNFDGKDKHRTSIGESAFIGCDTMLVAPVSVGDRAATGAGSVVTRDVPRNLLAVGVPARIRANNQLTDTKAPD
ncbi:MAG: bifunctional UDP-N-acetylglucosamine diphosphorylase/glucosamine-1-phosphate N-acetyltransferase GlmU [Chloroflexota bacterium]|nr:bifunctional UDP-N-acetylglucosamine diphosphorylase/glucosamine-1-phosphate N-acetyltransferase GlmU [Chloroflexota bacterium]